MNMPVRINTPRERTEEDQCKISLQLPFIEHFLHGTLALCMKVLVTQSCLTLCHPWTVSLQAPLPMEFSRQEYWNGLPFSSPEDIPDPEIEPRSPTLQVDSLPSKLSGFFMWTHLVFTTLWNRYYRCISVLYMETTFKRAKSDFLGIGSSGVLKPTIVFSLRDLGV